MPSITRDSGVKHLIGYLVPERNSILVSPIFNYLQHHLQ